MPELPEVQTVVATLSPRLVGRTIRKVHHLRQDIVTPDDVDLARRLTWRTLTSIARWASFSAVRVVAIAHKGLSRSGARVRSPVRVLKQSSSGAVPRDRRSRRSR